MDIRDVKKNLNRKVIHKSREGNSEYELTGCMLRCNRRTREFYYLAELQDLTNCRAVVWCGLEDIEEDTKRSVRA
jgi:hypothetical protein